MKHERVLLAGMLVAASFCGGALATLLIEKELPPE